MFLIFLCSSSGSLLHWRNFLLFFAFCTFKLKQNLTMRASKIQKQKLRLPLTVCSRKYAFAHILCMDCMLVCQFYTYDDDSLSHSLVFVHCRHIDLHYFKICEIKERGELSVRADGWNKFYVMKNCILCCNYNVFREWCSEKCSIHHARTHKKLNNKA